MNSFSQIKVRLDLQENVFVKHQIKTQGRAIGKTADPTEGYQSSVSVYWTQWLLIEGNW